LIELEVRLGERSYPIRIGPWRDWDLRSLTRGWARAPWALVVDRRAWDVWSRDILSCLGASEIDVRVLEIEGGEGAKGHQAVFRIYDHLMASGIRRDGTLAAFGGGVVGDIAGFAAATWMRGIRFVQIPTTLLAQVDASVGGKTGLNYGQGRALSGKNLIGAFHQPGAVLISPEWLTSLGTREFSAGLAEVVKCGIIRDLELLELLEAESPSRLPTSPALEQILARALVVKARIVEQDEHDHDLRHLLNFGHTVGHALEAATGFSRLLHGEAVALGMLAALRLSCAVAGLGEENLERIQRLLARYELPTRLNSVAVDAVLDHLGLDKKARSDSLVWVLTDRLGAASVFSGIAEPDIRQAVAYVVES